MIVYGANGSGKSGYVRILKSVCGGRGVRPILGNVFAPAPADQKCTISYIHNGTSKQNVWTPELGVHTDLRHVAVFDADAASVYVNKENELSVEPRQLSIFSSLVDCSENVSQAIEADISMHISKKPLLPPEFIATKAGVGTAR